MALKLAWTGWMCFSELDETGYMALTLAGWLNLLVDTKIVTGQFIHRFSNWLGGH